jgi:hypothetical protein
MRCYLHQCSEVVPTFHREGCCHHYCNNKQCNLQPHLVYDGIENICIAVSCHTVSWLLDYSTAVTVRRRRKQCPTYRLRRASYTCRMLLLFLNKSDLLIRCMPPTLADAVAAHQKVIGTITRGRHTATDRGHGPPHHLCVMTDLLYILKGH